MTSQLIFSLYYRSDVHQIRNGSVKECEVEMVGEECEVYCEDGRRRVLVLTGHAGRVAPISPMLKRRISCGLEILN